MNNVFEKSAQEYDDWFERNRPVYQSELRAIKASLPQGGCGLEIGVGTGRFAAPIGIEVGVEPARSMAQIAWNRGIKVCQAHAEDLPFRKELFDFVLMVTVLCFFNDPFRALTEAHRVLKPQGRLIIGMIDPDTPLGRFYEKKKEKSKFYQQAHFYPVRIVMDWLEQLGFGNIAIRQTLFHELSSITVIEPLRENHGSGGFVVIAGEKIK